MPIQAKVRSTTHRRGKTTNPDGIGGGSLFIGHQIRLGGRRTTLSFQSRLTLNQSASFLLTYPWSSQTSWTRGRAALVSSIGTTRSLMPSRSLRDASVTLALISNPSVSTRMWRFLPLTFLAPS